MKVTFPRGNRQTRPQGVLLVLLAAILFSFMNYAVRQTQGRVSPGALVFFRSVIQSFLLLPLAWGGRAAWREPGRLRYHLLRASFGVLAIYSLYQAVQRLPLAMATLLTLTSTVWTWLLSGFFLKERLEGKAIVFGALTWIGVALSLFPSGGMNWTLDPVGIFFGLLTGLCSGAAYTALRKMRRTLSTVEVVFFFGLGGIVFTGPAGLLGQWEVDGSAWPWILAAAVAATAAQVSMTAGFKETKAAIASLCMLIQNPVSLILGFLAFQEAPPLIFLVACGFILTGLMGLVKQQGPTKVV